MADSNTIFFQKGLQDLIKGIRSHKKDPSVFISQAMADIKAELRQTDPFIKAEAVRKLTYLQMLGYNVSWASFAIIEVMSQQRFAHKRIGYQAANQVFNETTDVILLTTNLFKKEFTAVLNSNQYDVGLAINCLANIATKDLARDCMGDLVNLMNHTKPYIRKKAVLAMYKLYVKFPQGLRLTFDKLKEKLDDPESSVVSTAVNVICELANKNPKNYLAMAPKLFRLLTTTSNNWMLIKVVKLLGSLVTEEPRLARKLLEPLATIIQNTGAKSLQYECIYTVTEALPHSRREDGSEAKNASAVVKICSDYLRGFIEDSDQNLKYLGLVGLVKLMKSNPRSVIDHRDLVLKCLNDDDITIRTKSLELLAGIVSKKSLVDLVRHLLGHAKLSEGAYRDEIISKILYMCRKEKYALVTDFAWYTSILLELAVMTGSKHGPDVADQLIEVAVRVEAVRPFSVEMMLSMILNESLLMGQARSTVCEVLRAAAWIVGEYSDIVSLIAADCRGDSLDGDNYDDEEDDSAYWIEGTTGEEIRSAYRGQQVHVLCLKTLLHPKITNLPPHVQVVFIHTAMKLLVRACMDCNEDEVAAIIGIIRTNINVFLQSENLEIQERSSSFRYLLAELDILPINWQEKADELERMNAEQSRDDLLQIDNVESIDHEGAKNAKQKKDILSVVINEKFYSVHSKAQRKVPVPDELNLELAFDGESLDRLLEVEIPENLQLASLYLVKPPSQILPNFDVFVNSEQDSRAKSFNSSMPEVFEENGGGTSADNHSVFTGRTTTTGSTNRTGTGEDVFYLSNDLKANMDIVPLSKILGDNFEEIPASSRSRRSKRESGKKASANISKKKGSSKIQVDVVDMLPAGFAGTLDEEEEEVDKTKKRRSTKKHSDEVGGAEYYYCEVDLQSVDIITPLAADEFLSVPTHRVVPDASILETADAKKRKSKSKSERTTKGDHSKSSKSKDKSKDSSKSKGTKDRLGSFAVDNLLGLDFTSAGESNTNANANTKDNTSSTSKLEEPSSKSYSGLFWLPLYSDKHMEISYHVSTSSNSNDISLVLKTCNHSKDGCSVSAAIKLLPNDPSRRFVKALNSEY
eukprot:gene21296-27592_t